MATNWQRIKVYTKLFFISVVILAAVVFIVSNRQLVTISFGWWPLAKIGAWLLMILAGLAGVVIFLVAGRTSSLLRDFRRLRSENKTSKQNSPNAD